MKSKRITFSKYAMNHNFFMVKISLWHLKLAELSIIGFIGRLIIRLLARFQGWNGKDELYFTYNKRSNSEKTK